MKRPIDEKKCLPSEVLHSILNGADTCLYVSDLQTDEILFINDKMKDHFHLGGDAVGGICWKTLQSGFDERCDFCPVYRLRDGEDEVVVWEEHNTLTGRYYRNIDRLIEWTNGKMAHLQHSTDITDIKMTQLSLKKRLEQQELMSAISQSFTTTQNTWTLIYEALKTAGMFMGVNQAFLAKYQQDEGCLECLYEWYDEKGTPYIGKEAKWPISPDMDIYKDLTVNGYAAVNDYTLLTHPNFQKVKHYDLQAFLNIPLEVSGEFWGVIGFIINKQKYEWSKSDIHLGKLIAAVFSGAVSRNIAEENLLRTKEMAELASRAKGDFLSRMSHEMRTPMNAIIGMTGIARKSDDPQRISYCLEKIDSASRHLLGLINDILDISKIEANKLELSLAEFDFERMLMNITGVVNFRVEEKKQNLIINIDKDVPRIFIGDEMRLSQVIANLLSNAIKFTPEGGTITLNVHISDISDKTYTLLFEVIDNGIGISKEQQARLFTPFEQADGGIARKYGGTGLGLTISKGIVELMEGRIWIESEAGQGAKFSFTMQMDIGKSIPRPELDKTLDKDNLRILVVDSAPEIRDYFMRLMPELGLACDVSGSGAEALKMMEKNAYDFVFVDWVLSDLNGVELTAKIKDNSRDNTIIMMIPQNDWSNIEKDAVSAGVARFVFKPFFPSILIDAINESIGVAPELKKTGNQAREYDFSGHTLLVAEDIEINREILSAILAETKASIDFAHNGAQAVAKLEKNPERYGLVLMDIQMPEMDGYEASKRIRSFEESEAKVKRIPIIAMTANVFREDVERCLQAGMDDHIGKPVDTDELFDKLDRYLNPSFR